MGVSIDGQICFGIALEEEEKLPWDSDEYDKDIEEWWIYAVHKYQPPFEIYGSDGEYLGSIKPSDKKINEYYRTKRDFKNAHPLPVELVCHCSDDYPMYILAIPRTVKVAHRGYPKEIKPTEMIVTQDECDLLIEFCKMHGIETEAPRWWLSSM